mmetsp:Transcript_147873/g.256108  ORF Transcript_147873/g.256108 Transcript_147873/m.256108 type:complete len:107 (-) Transcript_147873:62-382(-)
MLEPEQLEANVKILNRHFDRAQERVSEIGRLCVEAEASVKRSQALLNRSAREMHVLNERIRHLLGDPAEASGSRSRIGVLDQPSMMTSYSASGPPSTASMSSPPRH